MTDPKTFITHAVIGVGVDVEPPEFECPVHGNVGEARMTLILKSKIYNLRHDYCYVCYDEFLQGKRKVVNKVKQI